MGKLNDAYVIAIESNEADEFEMLFVRTSICNDCGEPTSLDLCDDCN